MGFIGGLGFLAGRFACGWLCPFGLLQDLLYRIPSPSLPFRDSLRPAKYAMLFILVLALLRLFGPFQAAGDPWFCKIVCPAGTALAGWPLVSSSHGAFQIGFLFWWKSAVAVLVLLWATTVERPFCRALCPLGAAWGIFGKVSMFRMRVSDSCVNCGKCGAVCPMGIDSYHNSTAQSASGAGAAAVSAR